MKPFSPGIFLLLLTSCQMVKTVKTDLVTYADGKTRTIQKTVIKKNRAFELHENFREQTNIRYDYFHNGKLKQYWKVVYINGSDATCYESFYRLEQYDSTGVKRFSLTDHCDCQKRKLVTYNAKGKKIKVEKTVFKRIE
jgi:hypothetical protein